MSRERRTDIALLWTKPEIVVAEIDWVRRCARWQPTGPLRQTVPATQLVARNRTKGEPRPERENRRANHLWTEDHSSIPQQSLVDCFAIDLDELRGILINREIDGDDSRLPTH